jgi:hypothetical protein
VAEAARIATPLNMNQLTARSEDVAKFYFASYRAVTDHLLIHQDALRPKASASASMVRVRVFVAGPGPPRGNPCLKARVRQHLRGNAAGASRLGLVTSGDDCPVKGAKKRLRVPPERLALLDLD